MKRRNFLIGAAVAAGGLALGYRVWTDFFEAQAATLVTGDGGSLLGGWVKIATDDTVTVYVPHVDMGQGTHTALAMMLAEELDADWSKVRTERAPGEKAFANRFLAEGWILQGWRPPAFLEGAIDTAFGEAARFANLQITGGSTAVRFTGQAGLRIIGAAARAMLIEAAARRWRVNTRELVAADSVVSHSSSGRTARYGELAFEAATLSVPTSPRFKPRQDYKIIGRSVPRLDIPAKVTGAMQYGIDVHLPGMIYATVKAAPVHGGRLQSVDPAPAMKVKGVERVVPLDDAVAVVAQGYWPASRGLTALAPVFSDGGNAAVSSSACGRSTIARSPARRASPSTRPAMPTPPSRRPRRIGSSRRPTTSPSCTMRRWSRSTPPHSSRTASSRCGPASRMRSRPRRAWSIGRAPGPTT